MNDANVFDLVIEEKLEMMEWLVQNGYVYDGYPFFWAANCSKIEGLEFLRSKECPWGTLTTELYAGGDGKEEYPDLVTRKWMSRVIS